MEYEGLTRDDLANVRALNRAWLKLENSDREHPARLSGGRLERLAAAPFLLFSFRERDEQWWQCLFDDRQQDLLDERPALTGEMHALQAAGLAFLWNLARRNPYAARVVCGAALSWCEQIASRTLLEVVDCAAQRDMLEPRFAYASPMHRRLLGQGSGALRQARMFTQIGALQAMLTEGRDDRYEKLAAAACRMPAPRQVADEV